MFDLRHRRSPRSLTLAPTVPNVFNEIIAGGRLALAFGLALMHVRIPRPGRSTAATSDFTERDNAPQLEPSTLQRFRSRDRIADNGDDANAPVNVTHASR